MNNKTYSGIISLSVSILVLCGIMIPAYAYAASLQEREAKAVGSTLEVHIQNNGRVVVRGAKITAITGSTVSAITGWDASAIGWSLNTSAGTKFLSRFGNPSLRGELSIGDFVSFEGSLVTTIASPLTVQASMIKDWSVQRKHATFAGSVGSVASSPQSFILNSEKNGAITVAVASSTQIRKSSGAGTFADIVAGVKVTASGLYNNLTKKLDADMVKTPAPAPVRTTLEGRIKTSPIGGAPTTMLITSGGADYTVNIATGISIINKNWLNLPLGSLRVGDSVRVYGAVNKQNRIIDATVIRDTSVK